MARPKGSQNKKEKVSYPRKCNECDYVANNPSMFHYHKKTHNKIPSDKLCDFGCGQKAVYINTKGSYTCTKKYSECPSYLMQLSERTSKSWENNETRRAQTKKIFLKHCSHNASARQKAKNAIKEKWGNFTPSEAKEYRHYARRIRVRAQKWAKENGYDIGKRTYHVDHRLSIFDAWALGLPEEIVNHPANLQVIPSYENESKGSTSCITLNELYEEIKEYGSVM